MPLGRFHATPVLQRVEHALGHRGLQRIDKLERLRPLQVALVIVEYLVQLASNAQEVRLRLTFERRYPRGELEALIQLDDILLRRLKLALLRRLNHLHSAGLAVHSVGEALHTSYSIGEIEVLLIQVLELLRELIRQRRVLLHESIFETAKNLLHPGRVVILFLHESSLRFEVTLDDA